MSTFADPRYQSLAAAAAGQLGGGPNLAKAILAQAQCENGHDIWPPPNNNPWNVTVGALRSIGIIRGPGSPSNIAALASTGDGVAMYVALVTGASRYAAALADAARDDGGAYLRDLLNAGWGTRLSCALGYYGGANSTQAGAVSGATLTAAGTESLAAFMGLDPSLHDSNLYHAVVARLSGSGARYVASGSPADAANLLAYIVWQAHIQPLDIAGLPNLLGLATGAGLAPGPTAGAVRIPVTADGHADMSTIDAALPSNAMEAGLPTGGPNLPNVVVNVTADLASGLGAAISGLVPDLAVLGAIAVLAFLGLRLLLEPGVGAAA